jgi:hypothetical protein
MTKQKLTTKRIESKTHYFINGEQATSYQYYKVYAQNKGYKNIYDLMTSKKYKGFDNERLECRLKEEFNERPEGLYEIPSAPEYYANTKGEIWCFSLKRKRWIQLTAYSHAANNDYTTIQPYKNGKRYVKYVHRLVSEAFNGEIPDTHEVHHIDKNPKNNNINNLELLPKEIHKTMKRQRKNLDKKNK